MSMNRRSFFSALAGAVAAVTAAPKVFSKPTGLAFHKDVFAMAPITLARKKIHETDVLDAPKQHPYVDGPCQIGDIIPVHGIFYPGTTVDRLFTVTSSFTLCPAVILRKDSPYYNADVDLRLYEVIQWSEDCPRSGFAISRLED